METPHYLNLHLAIMRLFSNFENFLGLLCHQYTTCIFALTTVRMNLEDNNRKKLT